MKYIIELEDQPISVKDSHTGEAYAVYKAKGFRALVFDERGVDRLERYDEEEAYHRGYVHGEKSALEKIAAEAKDDEIRVGDEVKYGGFGWRGIALNVGPKDFWALDETGRAAIHYKRNFIKTGRHFPEVEKLLEELRK